MSKQFGKQRGFTLIELLVVIAIIAILAAILFPVFARAKENANNTGCMTNLNQIGKATLTYLDDFEGYYWTGGQTYTSALSKYLKNVDVYKCKGDGRKNQFPVAGKLGARSSYLCNDQLWNWTDPSGVARPRLRMAEINVSSKFVLLCDDSFVAAGPTTATDEKMTYGITNSAHSFTLVNNKGRHAGVDNYVMADTHVRAVKGGVDSQIPDGAYIYQNLTWDPAKSPNPGEVSNY